MISAGSPGDRCRTRKTTTDTPSSTGTSSRSRRARYRVTGSAPGGASLDRGRLHAEVEARVELEALHALSERSDLDLVVHEHPRRVLDEDALGLAVELGPARLLGDL